MIKEGKLSFTEDLLHNESRPILTKFFRRVIKVFAFKSSSSQLWFFSPHHQNVSGHQACTVEQWSRNQDSETKPTWQSKYFISKLFSIKKIPTLISARGFRTYFCKFFFFIIIEYFPAKSHPFSRLAGTGSTFAKIQSI